MTGKKLTTGQMIDQLGMRDVAQNQKGTLVGYDRKGNMVMWYPEEDKPQDNEGNNFYMYYPRIKNDIWEIRYQYVDYEEAQSAHVDRRKTIRYVHTNGKEYLFVRGTPGPFKELGQEGITLTDLVRGKWLIDI